MSPRKAEGLLVALKMIPLGGGEGAVRVVPPSPAYPLQICLGTIRIVFLIKLDPSPQAWDLVRHEGKLKIWIRLDKGFGPIMSPSIFVCTMCVVEGPAGPTQLLLALLQLLPYLPTTSGSNIYTNYQNRSIDFYTYCLFRPRQSYTSQIL